MFGGAAVQVGRMTGLFNLLLKLEIKYHISAPRKPNDNPAEGFIQEPKYRFYQITSQYQVPKQLWDYLLTLIFKTGDVLDNRFGYS